MVTEDYKVVTQFLAGLTVDVGVAPQAEERALAKVGKVTLRFGKPG